MGHIVMDSDPIRRVEQAIVDIQQGKMVILVDDEDRENEGDLVMAASCVTPQAVNFMATHARGLICLTLTGAQIDRLGLPMMATHNQSPYSTAFTVSIEAREGVTTGISAADRAKTVLVAIDPESGPKDIVTPGHVFPLRARGGGVLVRTGQTEGSVDLARLAGMDSSGVICEIMKEDGTMARMPDLEIFAAKHELHIVAVADLIRYRMQNERLVQCVVEGRLPVPELGEFRCRVYRSDADGGLHVAISRGVVDPQKATLVRVQASDPVADVFRAESSDASAQLDASLRRIAEEGGVLLYLHVAGGRSEARLLETIKAHLLPPEGQEDTPRRPPGGSLREFGTGAQILVDLGVRRLRLLTNNPKKIVGLEGYGLDVVCREPIIVEETAANRGLLAAKALELGHLINLNNG
jgi:3,4-dihydroxy 2-butanone 4-phosphate synthase/GTP cyclohydrolase II